MSDVNRVFTLNLNEAHPELFSVLVAMRELINQMETALTVDRGNTETKEWTVELRDLKNRASREVKEKYDSSQKDELKAIRDYIEFVLSRYKEISSILDRRRQDQQIVRRIQQDPQAAAASGPETVSAIIAKGDKAQDETEAAIGRMKGMVGEAEEIGINTAKQMDAQIDQMERVGDKMGVIKEQNRQGRAKLRELGKGALRDRCIQIMLGLILLLLIGNLALLFTT